jgi:hypothetical protein
MIPHKNIILFMNAVRPATIAVLEDYNEQNNTNLTPIVFVEKKIKDSILRRNGQSEITNSITYIEVDFDSVTSIRKSIEMIDGEILCVVSQYENSIHELRKLIPYVPYLPAPNETSFLWATEKKLMRLMLEGYNQNLVPKHCSVVGFEDYDLLEIEDKIGTYPYIVKPSGLEGSLLVSLVHSRLELKNDLMSGFKNVQNAYDTWIKRQKPSFIVEEFMDGDMYSIDTYVDENGSCTFTPLIRVITGKKVGFDDFFGYARIASPAVSVNETAAQEAAQEACKALGLKSITAHVELMLTGEIWKIIELAPRIGGYRHELLTQSYGINHILNDILVRANLPVSVTRTRHNSSAMLNIYAHEEGVIAKFEGGDLIKELPSIISFRQNLHIGDTALSAKHNGDPVFEILLSNPDENQLYKDYDTVTQKLLIKINKIGD